MSNTTVNGTSYISDDAQKRKQIQQQLVLIFHACRCQKLFEVRGVNPCSNAHCAMMRNVLTHMSQCTTERLCPFSHCSTSKRILSHWKRCGQMSCLICAPIRNKEIKNEQIIKTENINFNSNFEKKLTNGNLMESNDKNDIENNWKEAQCTKKIRKSINQKILLIILPKLNDSSHGDKRVELLLEQVKGVEREAFIKATSQNDYYSILAKQIYVMQKEAHRKSDLVSQMSDSRESDCVQEIHKAIENEYELQNKLLNESEIKIEHKTENIDNDSIKKETNNEMNQKKIWLQEDIKYSFSDLFNSIKNNKILFQFLSQIDKTNYDSSKFNINNIIQKFEDQQYIDPWDIACDINGSIKNGFIMSKKSRKTKKDTIQYVTEVQDQLDIIMKRLGFCCGKDEVYQPLTLECSTANFCPINKDAVYYAYQSENSDSYGDAAYICCEKCYSECINEVSFNTESSEAFIVRKEQLEKKKNNVEIPEEIITCLTCGRRCHKVCECFSEDIWSKFHCKLCIDSKTIRGENKFTAKKLATCNLSRFLEKRVNDYLKKNEIQSEHVIIRVLSNVKKVTEIKPNVKTYYTNAPTEFPYRSKSIFAFQEHKGKEICFFGLLVQEYGSDCPEPNKRRVYIAYLDSVRFFEPAKHRTKVYYEILVRYLDYAKKLGYLYAHIWACPPTEGDDYIFNIHPPDQKVPKPKRLQEWYAKMLDKGIQELVVNDYKDIFKDVQLNNVKAVTEIPYFEGDFWSNEFEVMLKESGDNSKKNVDQDEFMDDDNEDGDDSSHDYNHKKAKKRKQKKAPSANSKKRKVNGNINTAGEFFKKILEIMEKHKDNFFTIRLHPELDIPNLPETNDPDPNIESDLMDGRENFLQMSRSKHLEFSSLRRALYSTMIMCYELHMEGKQTITFTCNTCNYQIETRYHCKICPEFDLCETCYQKRNHEHEFEYIKASDIATANDSRNETKIEESSRNQIDKFVKIFEHSNNCRDVNCRIGNCRNLKTWLGHFKQCQNKNNCPICKKLYVLSNIHAKYCKINNCQILLCQNIKLSMRKNDSRQRMRQKKLIRRRTENMRYNNTNNASVETNIATPTTPAAMNSMITAQSPHNPYTNSGPMSNSSLNNHNLDQGTPPKVIRQESYSNNNKHPQPSPQTPLQQSLSTQMPSNNSQIPPPNIYSKSSHNMMDMVNVAPSQYVYPNGVLSCGTPCSTPGTSAQPSIQQSIPPQTPVSNKVIMNEQKMRESCIDQESLEMYKACMSKPDGQMNINEMMKNNSSIPNVYQMRHNIPQQRYINVHQNPQMIPQLNMRYPNNIPSSQFLPNNHPNNIPIPNMNGIQSYQQIPDMRCNPRPMSQIHPSPNMQINRYPANMSQQHIDSYPIPNQPYYRYQSNHPPINNGMINSHPQVYPKMLNNQKPFNHQTVFQTNANDPHSFRTSQNSYY